MTSRESHSSINEITYLADGGEQAVAELFSQNRQRLRNMVAFRLDPRLAGRVDPEDVLQEAYLEAARRRQDYLQNPSVTFFVWLRTITWQILTNVHRRHLQAQRRSTQQEVSLDARGGGSNSNGMAQQLAANWTSPSEAAIRHEQHRRLRQALESLTEIDREVLALRHFEQLTNEEVAQTLGLTKTAASNRYVRAIRRLKKVLEETDG